MRAVRHLSYSLLVPAINRYVGNVTSWWNTKQGGRGNNTQVFVKIQGLFTRNQDGFWLGKNHRDAASGWRFLLDSSFRYTAWHFPCSPPIRNHSWHFCTYSHCCSVMGHYNVQRPGFVEIVLLNTAILPLSPIFVYCDVAPVDVNTTSHPGAHVNITFCYRLAASRLVYIYPGVL